MIFTTPKIFTFLGIIFLIAAVIFIVFMPVRVQGEMREIVIESGIGSSAIADMLESEGFIRSKVTFLGYTYLTRTSGSLQAGTYKISSSMSLKEIVRILSRGLTENDDITVTIPEGSTVWDIEKKLISAGFAKEGEFISSVRGSEGYLFPDTYRFSRNSTINDIEKKMVENFQFRSSSLIRDPERDEIVIASLLEKEAQKDIDMRTVAGIIYKRLKINMALQIDASALYNFCFVQKMSICDWKNIGAREAIAVDGPYNTYKNPGLPIGPISNPGLRAIEAAMNPVTTDYLYYLSTRDGEVIYSKTSEEHERNRAKYLNGQ